MLAEKKIRTKSINAASFYVVMMAFFIFLCGSQQNKQSHPFFQVEDLGIHGGL